VIFAQVSLSSSTTDSFIRFSLSNLRMYVFSMKFNDEIYFSTDWTYEIHKGLVRTSLFEEDFSKSFQFHAFSREIYSFTREEKEILGSTYVRLQISSLLFSMLETFAIFLEISDRLRTQIFNYEWDRPAKDILDCRISAGEFTYIHACKSYSNTLTFLIYSISSFWHRLS